MPIKCAHNCPVPGCPRTTRKRYCYDHEHLEIRTDYRPSASQRGYDHKWHMNSKRFLKANPICKCRRRSEIAHHLIPKAKGGSDRWDNLEALCRVCHGKAEEEMRG